MSDENRAVKIRVQNLKKSFGSLEVLKDISTDIMEGEVVVIIGPSGSGKSTFLRCLNRLEEVSGGKIWIGDTDITQKKVNINKVRENIGMVFQHFNLFKNLNILDNMTLAPIQLKKCSAREAKERAKREAEREEQRKELQLLKDELKAQRDAAEKERAEREAERAAREQERAARANEQQQVDGNAED